MILPKGPVSIGASGIKSMAPCLLVEAGSHGKAITSRLGPWLVKPRILFYGRWLPGRYDLSATGPGSSCSGYTSAREWLLAHRRLFIGALLGLFALVLLGTAGPLRAFQQDRLEIETSVGERHVFRIELAVDPADRARGLMFRRGIAEDAGMLFLYEPAQQPVMWMKNTYIPLDMLFIRSDGVIAQIVRNTVPHALDRIAAEVPVTAVLELEGGTAGRLGIGPGDRVHHSAFSGGK